MRFKSHPRVPCGPVHHCHAISHGGTLVDVTEDADRPFEMDDAEMAALVRRMLDGDTEAFTRLFGAPIGEPDP